MSEINRINNSNNSVEFFGQKFDIGLNDAKANLQEGQLFNFESDLESYPAIKKFQDYKEKKLQKFEKTHPQPEYHEIKRNPLGSIGSAIAEDKKDREVNKEYYTWLEAKQQYEEYVEAEYSLTHPEYVTQKEEQQAEERRRMMYD